MTFLNTLVDLNASGVGFGEVAHTLSRVALGLFFAISGQFKLRDATNLLATFKDDHIPFPNVMRWFVPSVELMAGLALIVGLLTPLAALGLMSLCLVATFTDGIKRYQDSDVLSWIDDFLWLPDVLYCIMCGYLITTGAGPWSVDALLAAMI